MDTYKEYVIRCKTCNEPLACYGADYQALLDAGSTVEDALNELGIIDYCSRNAMMNPTIVAFNMENRAVIEGFKSVDAVTEDETQEESTSQPIFSSCLGAGNLNPNINPLAAPQLTGIQPMTGARATPNIPGPTLPIQQLIPGMQTIGLIHPIIKPLQGFPITQIQPTHGNITPIIKLGVNIVDDQPDIDEGLGAGIPIDIPERMEKKFQEPTVPGIPTINPDTTVPQSTVYVGAGKYVHVLNGRTYLAR